MADQRLSKLQKWILENCFRVTILLDRAELKPLQNCRDSYKCTSCDIQNAASLERDSNNVIFANCIGSGQSCFRSVFYREDVLLSYFGLASDNAKCSFFRVQHFRDSPDYAKAHATLSRCLKNLVEKGLIYLWRVEDESQRICLTEKGIIIAAELAKTDDFFIPDLLSDDERESIKQKLMQDYQDVMTTIRS